MRAARSAAVMAGGGGQRVITVTITGQGTHSACFARINGQHYFRPGKMEIERGTVIECGVTKVKDARTLIEVNNTVVLQDESGTYSFVAARDVNIDLSFDIIRGSFITITY